MPKVKLLVSRTGGQDRGDVVEVTADEVQRMIDAGQCELVRDVKPEKAVKRSKFERADK